MTLLQRLDHMHGLSAQASAVGPRVVYGKAGTIVTAAVLNLSSVVVDHMAYWMAARNADEARYVVAIMNSPEVLARVTPLQARGQTGPRHFDNLV
jgi:hypothetical protein